MMREIKFRAFYKPAKTMFYMDDLVDEEHFEDLRTGNYNACEWSALMQYTGLKDKNGKKIYEGDILRKDCHWGFYVGFDNGSFRSIPCDPVQRINHDHHPLNHGRVDGWEVIGNIHENLELLEEE